MSHFKLVCPSPLAVPFFAPHANMMSALIRLVFELWGPEKAEELALPIAAGNIACCPPTGESLARDGFLVSVVFFLVPPLKPGPRTTALGYLVAALCLDSEDAREGLVNKATGLEPYIGLKAIHAAYEAPLGTLDQAQRDVCKAVVDKVLAAIRAKMATIEKEETAARQKILADEEPLDFVALQEVARKEYAVALEKQELRTKEELDGQRAKAKKEEDERRKKREAEAKLERQQVAKAAWKMARDKSNWDKIGIVEVDKKNQEKWMNAVARGHLLATDQAYDRIRAEIVSQERMQWKELMRKFQQNKPEDSDWKPPHLERQYSDLDLPEDQGGQKFFPWQHRRKSLARTPTPEKKDTRLPNLVKRPDGGKSRAILQNASHKAALAKGMNDQMRQMLEDKKARIPKPPPKPGKESWQAAKPDSIKNALSPRQRALAKAAEEKRLKDQEAKARARAQAEEEERLREEEERRRREQAERKAAEEARRAEMARMDELERIRREEDEKRRLEELERNRRLAEEAEERRKKEEEERRRRIMYGEGRDVKITGNSGFWNDDDDEVRGGRKKEAPRRASRKIDASQVDGFGDDYDDDFDAPAQPRRWSRESSVSDSSSSSSDESAISMDDDTIFASLNAEARVAHEESGEKENVDAEALLEAAREKRLLELEAEERRKDREREARLERRLTELHRQKDVEERRTLEHELEDLRQKRAAWFRTKTLVMARLARAQAMLRKANPESLNAAAKAAKEGGGKTKKDKKEKKEKKEKKGKKEKKEKKDKKKK
eukprot:NODE_41_length_3243_cov_27.625548_g32_i0.p1 GENE.NODE_41_length_3243_cov_27.625548_g32_i0~~NODE_41_length_3243_cov_27.625548_g32_i0.p1  ORF type:complete len:779 (+),score=350.57 NODE_41_length_3243_cov_27.625548_g32_i0:798-3134(+)